ncbi:MAG: hypothetical protein GY859_23340, partial [Desulfobacterales bacterium]|nr:hypothetical protein [Desulfobacterales bacterium]
GLLIRRDAAWLQWRYLDCPDDVHRIFAVRRWGRLMGWGVFARRGEMLAWGDALFDQGGKNAAPFLLARVLQRFPREIHHVAGWFSPTPAWWTGALLKCGFEITREPNDLTPACALFDDRFSMEWIERRRYYTMGDSDLF